MPKWQGWLAFATSLYPVYMMIGGIIAFWKPSAFAWFVKRGPDSYSAALGVIMLAMGFTLEIKDLIHVLTKRPAAVRFLFQGLSFRLCYWLQPANCFLYFVLGLH